MKDMVSATRGSGLQLGCLDGWRCHFLRQDSLNLVGNVDFGGLKLFPMSF